MTSDSDSTPAGGEPRQLRPGIKMLFASLVIVVMSLGLFIFAIGVPPATDQQPQVKHIPLAISMIGFGASSLLFWIAFMKLAKVRR
jgi:hypothetical protein